MNFATIIVIALVVAAVAAAVYFTIRRRQAGKSPYCSGCALKDTCTKK
ncbi:MAG: FeoB-associated Cys-rich membrane protein [Bacteroidales bacterium]|nr:FeoB-associated Cys-rich membrane protein [Bacteroidales bacterium]